MTSSDRKLWYLRRLNLFAGMDPAEMEAIASKLRERVCRRGEAILDRHGDRIYLVKGGTVRVYRISPDGRELTTAILRPGQLFGTSALVGAADQPAFVEAMEDAYVCEASAEQFLRVMSGHPKLAAKVMVTLARQALRLEQQLERLAFQEVPVRLAQTLLQLAEDHGGELPPNLTHEELARLVGATRATVTRALAQFADEGLVELGYRRLAIRDAAGLRRQAGLDDGA